MMDCTQVLLSDPVEIEPSLEKLAVATLEVDGIFFTIYNSENLIGRDETCDIVIQSSVISSRHAIIEADDPAGHFVYDLGSTNKTKLGQITLKPHVRYHINDGDALTFGNISALYNVSRQYPSTPEKTRSQAVPETPDKEVDDIVSDSSPEDNERDESLLDKSDVDIFCNEETKSPVQEENHETSSKIDKSEVDDIYEMETLNFGAYDMLPSDKNVSKQINFDALVGEEAKEKCSDRGICESQNDVESIYDVCTQNFETNDFDLDTSVADLKRLDTEKNNIDFISSNDKLNAFDDSIYDIHTQAPVEEAGEISNCEASTSKDSRKESHCEWGVFRDIPSPVGSHTSDDDNFDCPVNDEIPIKDILNKNSHGTLDSNNKHNTNNVFENDIVPVIDDIITDKEKLRYVINNVVKKIENSFISNREISIKNTSSSPSSPQNVDIFESFDCVNDSTKENKVHNTISDFNESDDEAMNSIVSQILPMNRSSDNKDLRSNDSLFEPATQPMDIENSKKNINESAIQVDETLSSSYQERFEQPTPSGLTILNAAKEDVDSSIKAGISSPIIVKDKVNKSLSESFFEAATQPFVENETDTWQYNKVNKKAKMNESISVNVLEAATEPCMKNENEKLLTPNIAIVAGKDELISKTLWSTNNASKSSSPSKSLINALLPSDGPTSSLKDNIFSRNTKTDLPINDKKNSSLSDSFFEAATQPYVEIASNKVSPLNSEGGDVNNTLITNDLHKTYDNDALNGPSKSQTNLLCTSIDKHSFINDKLYPKNVETDNSTPSKEKGKLSLSDNFFEASTQPYVEIECEKAVPFTSDREEVNETNISAELSKESDDLLNDQSKSPIHLLCFPIEEQSLINDAKSMETDNKISSIEEEKFGVSDSFFEAATQPFPEIERDKVLTFNSEGVGVNKTMITTELSDKRNDLYIDPSKSPTNLLSPSVEERSYINDKFPTRNTEIDDNIQSKEEEKRNVSDSFFEAATQPFPEIESAKVLPFTSDGEEVNKTMISAELSDKRDDLLSDQSKSPTNLLCSPVEERSLINDNVHARNVGTGRNIPSKGKEKFSLSDSFFEAATQPIPETESDKVLTLNSEGVGVKETVITAELSDKRDDLYIDPSKSPMKFPISSIKEPSHIEYKLKPRSNRFDHDDLLKINEKSNDNLSVTFFEAATQPYVDIITDEQPTLTSQKVKNKLSITPELPGKNVCNLLSVSSKSSTNSLILPVEEQNLVDSKVNPENLRTAHNFSMKREMLSPSFFEAATQPYEEIEDYESGQEKINELSETCDYKEHYIKTQSPNISSQSPVKDKCLENDELSIQKEYELSNIMTVSRSNLTHGNVEEGTQEDSYIIPTQPACNHRNKNIIKNDGVNCENNDDRFNQSLLEAAAEPYVGNVSEKYLSDKKDNFHSAMVGIKIEKEGSMNKTSASDSKRDSDHNIDNKSSKEETDIHGILSVCSTRHVVNDLMKNIVSERNVVHIELENKTSQSELFPTISHEDNLNTSAPDSLYKLETKNEFLKSKHSISELEINKSELLKGNNQNIYDRDTEPVELDYDRISYNLDNRILASSGSLKKDCNNQSLAAVRIHEKLVKNLNELINDYSAENPLNFEKTVETSRLERISDKNISTDSENSSSKPMIVNVNIYDALTEPHSEGDSKKNNQFIYPKEFIMSKPPDCKEVQMELSESILTGHSNFQRVVGNLVPEVVSSQQKEINETIHDAIDMSISCLNLPGMLSQEGQKSSGPTAESNVLDHSKYSEDMEKQSFLLDNNEYERNRSRVIQDLNKNPKSSKEKSATYRIINNNLDISSNIDEKSIKQHSVKEIKEENQRILDSTCFYYDSRTDKDKATDLVKIGRSHVSNGNSQENLTLGSIESTSQRLNFSDGNFLDSEEPIMKCKKKGYNMFPPDSQDEIDSKREEGIIESLSEENKEKIIKGNGSEVPQCLINAKINDEILSSSEELVIKFNRKKVNIFPPDSEESISQKEDENVNYEEIRIGSPLCNQPADEINKSSSPKQNENKSPSKLSRSPSTREQAFVSRGNITLHSQEVLDELEEQFKLATNTMISTQLSMPSDSEDDVPNINDSPIVRRSERKRNANSLFKPIVKVNTFNIVPEVKDSAPAKARQKKSFISENHPGTSNCKIPEDYTITDRSPKNASPSGEQKCTKSVKIFKKVNPQNSDLKRQQNTNTSKGNVSDNDQNHIKESTNSNNSVGSNYESSDSEEFGRGKRKRTKTSFDGFVLDDEKNTDISNGNAKANNKKQTQESTSCNNSFSSYYESSDSEEFGRGKRKRTKTSFDGFVLDDKFKKLQKRSPSASPVQASKSENVSNVASITKSMESQLNTTVAVVLHDVKRQTDLSQDCPISTSEKVKHNNSHFLENDDDDLIVPPKKPVGQKSVTTAKKEFNNHKTKGKNKNISDNTVKCNSISFSEKLDELFNIWGPADRVKLSPRASKNVPATSKIKNKDYSDNNESRSSLNSFSNKKCLNKNFSSKKSKVLKSGNLSNKKSGSSKSSFNDNLVSSKPNASDIIPKTNLKHKPTKVNCSEEPIKKKVRKSSSESDSTIDSNSSVNSITLLGTRRSQRSQKSILSSNPTEVAEPIQESTCSSGNAVNNNTDDLLVNKSNSASTNLQSSAIGRRKKPFVQNKCSEEIRKTSRTQNVNTVSKNSKEVISKEINTDSSNMPHNNNFNERKRNQSPDDFCILSQEISFRERSMVEKSPVKEEFIPPQLPVRRSKRSKNSEEGAEKHGSEKVMFTGPTNNEIQKLVTKLGGEVVHSPFTCTVLVTDKVRRTFKFLSALSRGLPIVTPEWLYKSKDEFADASEFIVNDKDAEKLFSFSLKESITKARTTKLLDGWTVYITPSVKSLEDIKGIIECSGGKSLSKEPARWPPNSLIISCQEDKTKWGSLMKRGKRPYIVEPEALFSGILKQDLNLEKHRLI